MVEGEMQGLAACASHEGDEMMAGAGCRCHPNNWKDMRLFQLRCS